MMEQFRNNEKTDKLHLYHNTSVHMAVIMFRGKIISKATNRVGSRSKGCGFSNYTIHAEKNAVKQLGDYTKLKGADMYIMREGRGENKSIFINSTPCADCQYFLHKCMKKYGLKNVYYTT
jgi:hypothetical protein